MGEMQTSILVRFTENSAAVGRRITRNVQGFTNSSSRHLKTLKRSAASASRGLDRLGNRYTGLLTGAAGIGTARMLMQHEERFTRLGIQAQKSAVDIEHLNGKIFEASLAPDIRVDPSQIISAVEEIVEKTGDLEFAEKNLRNIGLVIQATGAGGKAVGSILAEFQKMDIKNPDQVLKAIDILNVQGKEGAFTLQDLARLGSRVVTAYTATGRSGVQAMREMGAVMQVIRQGTGNSEQAVTSFEALLKTLGETAKIKKLYASGIQVFDQKELEKGREIIRPINELMVEIIKKAEGKKTMLSEVFDSEAMRAFNAANAEYLRTGSVGSLEKFFQVQADGTTTTQDSARAAKTLSAGLQGLLTVWERWANDRLHGPFEMIADDINRIDPDKLDKIIDVAATGAVALGGLVVANKVARGGYGAYKFGRDMLGKLSGKGGKGAGGIADALSGGAGPLPVYVVNKHLSMLPGKDGFGLPGAKAPGKAGKGVAGRGASLLSWLKGSRAGALGKLGSMGSAGGVLAGGVKSAGLLSTAGGVTTAALAGYGLGTQLNKYLIDGTAAQHKLADVVGQLVAVVPVLGKKAKLAVEINTKGNGKANITEMTATGMELDVDAGLVMIGG